MEQTSAPKVSVLMAVKDGGKYLREAVDSVLAQTFSNFEFIIMDDGSQDGTAQILAEYSDPRVVLLKNKTSIGLTKSLNLGLGKAKGEYIARMDADDISLSGRLAAQVSFLNDHPEVGVLGTAASLIDSQGMVGDIVQYPERHSILCWIMCFFENPIIHPSVMFRKKMIMEVGGYDEKYVTSQDFNLWSRAAEYANLANIQDVYLYLRKHEENISHTRYHQQQEFSIKISASLISNNLNYKVQPAQINGYCDFLWNRIKMPGSTISFAAGVVYRLAKIFLGKPQMIPFDRLWIFENAVNRLNDLQKELGSHAFDTVKLDYWKWSLKRSL